MIAQALVVGRGREVELARCVCYGQTLYECML